MLSLIKDFFPYIYFKLAQLRVIIYRPFFKQIGYGTSIQFGCYFNGMKNIKIGNRVYINHHVELLAEDADISIGNYVMIGQYSILITDSHNYEDKEKLIALQGSTNEKIIIANIGVLSIRKGQKYLVESFRILSQKYDNIVLLIFGSGREHEAFIEEELHKMIENYGLNGRVKIINPRKDINLIYNIFDIYVMPSITEGQSLCVIEAMFMERLCLLSDIPSFSEMVEEGVNGFLFKTTDVEDLTNKLEYLIKSYKDLNYIGKSARAIALKKYNKKKMVANYLSVYLTGKLNNFTN